MWLFATQHRTTKCSPSRFRPCRAQVFARIRTRRFPEQHAVGRPVGSRRDESCVSEFARELLRRLVCRRLTDHGAVSQANIRQIASGDR